MQQRPKIRHVWAIDYDIANDEFTGPLQGGQDQVSVLQVPLLGHGGAIETLNLVCRYNSPNEALALVLVPCLLPLWYVTNFVTHLLNC